MTQCRDWTLRERVALSNLVHQGELSWDEIGFKLEQFCLTRDLIPKRGPGWYSSKHCQLEYQKCIDLVKKKNASSDVVPSTALVEEILTVELRNQNFLTAREYQKLYLKWQKFQDEIQSDGVSRERLLAIEKELSQAEESERKEKEEESRLFEEQLREFLDSRNQQEREADATLVMSVGNEEFVEASNHTAVGAMEESCIEAPSGQGGGCMEVDQETESLKDFEEHKQLLQVEQDVRVEASIQNNGVLSGETKWKNANSKAAALDETVENGLDSACMSYLPLPKDEVKLNSLASELGEMEDKAKFEVAIPCTNIPQVAEPVFSEEVNRLCNAEKSHCVEVYENYDDLYEEVEGETEGHDLRVEEDVKSALRNECSEGEPSEIDDRKERFEYDATSLECLHALSTEEKEGLASPRTETTALESSQIGKAFMAEVSSRTKENAGQEECTQCFLRQENVLGPDVSFQDSATADRSIEGDIQTDFESENENYSAIQTDLEIKDRVSDQTNVSEQRIGGYIQSDFESENEKCSAIQTDLEMKDRVRDHSDVTDEEYIIAEPGDGLCIQTHESEGVPKSKVNQEEFHQCDMKQEKLPDTPLEMVEEETNEIYLREEKGTFLEAHTASPANLKIADNSTECLKSSGDLSLKVHHGTKAQDLPEPVHLSTLPEIRTEELASPEIIEINSHVDSGIVSSLVRSTSDSSRKSLEVTEIAAPILNEPSQQLYRSELNEPATAEPGGFECATHFDDVPPNLESVTPPGSVPPLAEPPPSLCATATKSRARASLSPNSKAMPAPSQGARTESSRAWRRSLLFLISEISGHKYASLFQRPVRSVDAPRYHERILRSTSLHEIKKGIEDGKLVTLEEVLRELLLLFTNAVMFNPPGGTICLMAKEMEADVLKMVLEFARNNRLSQLPESVLHSLEERVEETQERKSKTCATHFRRSSQN